jgi:hypothetical protein
MDVTSAWLHNINIDRTLNRLGTYIDPSKRATLLKILIEEEDKLGTGPDQLERAERRMREGQARIYRTLVVIERLIDCGLMDEKTFSKALEVVSTIRKSQALIEQRYQRIVSKCSDCEN